MRSWNHDSANYTTNHTTKNESTPDDASAPLVKAFKTTQQNYYNGLESQADDDRDFDDSCFSTSNSNNNNGTRLFGYSACPVTCTHSYLFSTIHLSSFLAAEANITSLLEMPPSIYSMMIMKNDASILGHHTTCSMTTKHFCCITLLLIELSP